MQILTFIIVIGIAIVVFYLFMRKILSNDRLVFPDEKPEPEGEKPEKNPIDFKGDKSAPPNEKGLGPDKEEPLPKEGPLPEKEPLKPDKAEQKENQA